MSVILSSPTWPSLFQTDWLDQISGMTGSGESIQSEIIWQGGYWHVRQGLVLRFSYGPGSVYSEELTHGHQ